MRVLVFGPGAIGTLLAVHLARGGAAVTLAARAEAVAALARDGIALEGPPEERIHPPVVPSDGPLDAPEAVLLAVKSYDLADAARRLAPTPPVATLLIQNGLDPEGTVRAASPPGPAADRPWVRAIVSLPARRVGAGRVRETGVGEVVLPERPDPARAEAVATWAGLLVAGGIPVRRVADFDREVWRKLLVNAAINPVTAMHGVENGRLSEDPWRGQALQLLEEARQVAGCEGFVFAPEEAERELFTVVRATAANHSSMLQDREAGRPMEIDAICGAVIERGARHGLDLPATRRAVERLRGAAGAPPPSQGS